MNKDLNKDLNKDFPCVHHDDGFCVIDGIRCENPHDCKRAEETGQ